MAETSEDFHQYSTRSLIRLCATGFVVKLVKKIFNRKSNTTLCNRSCSELLKVNHMAETSDEDVEYCGTQNLIRLCKVVMTCLSKRKPHSKASSKEEYQSSSLMPSLGSKLFRKAFWTVTALAIFSMIRDLAEACGLKIKYA